MELRTPIESLKSDLDVYNILIRDIKLFNKGSHSKIESLTKSKLQTEKAIEILEKHDIVI